jgi:hypothetical protein
MTLLAAVVVLLVFGPPILIVAGVLILSAIGLFLSGASRIVAKVFRCPFKQRDVRTEFVIEPGAAHPSSVASCSAFRDPKRVTCARHCLELADVHWTAPTGMFARWALISDGVAEETPTRSPVVGSAMRHSD